MSRREAHHLDSEDHHHSTEYGVNLASRANRQTINCMCSKGKGEVRRKAHLRLGTIYPIIPGRLSFAVHQSQQEAKKNQEINPDKCFLLADFAELYEPLCYDFGPVNIGVIHSFCSFLRKFWDCPLRKEQEIVYYSVRTQMQKILLLSGILASIFYVCIMTDHGCVDVHQMHAIEVRTNSVFLLASFLVVELGYTAQEAWAPFRAIRENSFATFRDASDAPQDYDLTIPACLQALAKAKGLGWYSSETFDAEEYERLDDPMNADMHMITPKFAALKGPVSPTNTEEDDDIDSSDSEGVCTFAPEHYVPLFREKEIQSVVRLNEPHTYDPKVFADEGFAHYELYFLDCSVPSHINLVRFLRIANSHSTLAVHCRAGLGRTGTLIAAYMIRYNGFTAAESIAWLRIVRPGSILGPQQHYLHFVENAFATLPAPTSAGASEQVEDMALLQHLVRTERAARGGLARMACSPPKDDARARGRHVAEAQERRDMRRIAAKSAQEDQLEELERQLYTLMDECASG